MRKKKSVSQKGCKFKSKLKSANHDCTVRVKSGWMHARCQGSRIKFSMQHSCKAAIKQSSWQQKKQKEKLNGTSGFTGATDSKRKLLPVAAGSSWLVRVRPWSVGTLQMEHRGQVRCQTGACNESGLASMLA